MTVVTEKIIIEIDGVEYRARLATIKRTEIGQSERGWTSWLHLDGDGWGQGAGGFGLKGEALYVWMKGILGTLGVDRWESLPGIKLLALYEMDSGGYGFIKGIKALDSSKAVLFEQMFVDAGIV